MTLLCCQAQSLRMFEMFEHAKHDLRRGRQSLTYPSTNVVRGHLTINPSFRIFPCSFLQAKEFLHILAIFQYPSGTLCGGHHFTAYSDTRPTCLHGIFHHRSWQKQERRTTLAKPNCYNTAIRKRNQSKEQSWGERSDMPTSKSQE